MIPNIINPIRTSMFPALTLVILLAIVACSGDAASPAPPMQAPQTAAAPTQASQAATAPTTAPVAPQPAPAMSEPVRVVTTLNIVADWVQNIGGDRVEVVSLLPIGSDPHTFQPGARDVATIADADLVLSVGLGLEDAWMHELIENAARDESSVVQLAEIADPIEFVEADSHAEELALLEALSHVVHEVEDGEISAEEGLSEIREAIEAAEDHHEEEEEDEDHHEEEEEDEDHHEEDEEDEDHHDEEEEDEDHHEEEEHGHEDESILTEMVLDIIAQAEAGQFDAEHAIEEIEHLVEAGEDEHDEHDHGAFDPHFWFDPLRVQLAVNDIAARLSVLDPDGRGAYTANAAAYNAQLDEFHAWTQQQVAAVPDVHKLLVTSHHSLGYFANLYGFDIVGVILSTTTEVEPSASDLAELTHTVEEYGVPAIFGELTVSERLATSLAAETGVEVFRLYSGSLGIEGSGAETYLGMFGANVEIIVDALK